MIKNLKWICLFLLILLIILIFTLSLTTNETLLSIKSILISSDIEVSLTDQENYVKQIQTKLLLRKLFGHIIPFFLLGILSINTFYLFDINIKKGYLISIIIILIVSIISEILQFIPVGRNPSYKDVLINFTSSFIGLNIAFFIIHGKIKSAL